MKKRIASIILSLVMLLSLLPVTAAATDPITVTVAQAATIAAGLEHNTPSEATYSVTGYVTDTNGQISLGQQTFWLDDVKGDKKTFEGYFCTLPENEDPLNVGDKVNIVGNILRYNSTYEMKFGVVTIIERASTTYAITNGTAQNANGSITVAANAAENDTVTVTVTPNEGYALKTLTVVPTEGGTAIETTQDQQDETKYTFKMPAAAVTVTATFEAAAEKISVLVEDATLTKKTSFFMVDGDDTENKYGVTVRVNSKELEGEFTLEDCEQYNTGVTDLTTKKWFDTESCNIQTRMLGSNTLLVEGTLYTHNEELNRSINAQFKLTARIDADGELMDAYGGIVEPAKGETLTFNRSENGTAFYSTSGGIGFGNQSGETTMVAVNDTTYYWYNPISKLTTGYWIKGTKDKDAKTISFDKGQVICVYNNGALLGLMEWVKVTGAGQLSVPKDKTEPFVLDIDGNTLTLRGSAPFDLSQDVYFPGVVVPSYGFQKYGDAGTKLTTTYAITNGTAQDAHGSITVAKSAAEGATVTVTVTPDEGYQLKADSLKVYKTGDESTTVSATKQDDGTYQFTMPAYAVTVTATFEAAGNTPSGNVPYSFDFETNPFENGWTNIDADGDGFGWDTDTVAVWGDNFGINETHCAFSMSYAGGGGARQANNWMFSPAITIPEDGATVSWYEQSQSASYPDSYKVYVSETNTSTDSSGMTQLYSGTAANPWTQKTVNLSAKDYGGKTVYIAFQHNDYDNYALAIDNFAVETLATCTYTVTFPEGPEQVYIIGNTSNWLTFTPMTMTSKTTATITLETPFTEYKYAAGADWTYVEKDAQGGEISNRTACANPDVVGSWAAVPSPYHYTEYENWQLKHEGSEWQPTGNLTKVEEGLFKLADAYWTGSGFNVLSDENPIKKDWFAPEDLTLGEEVHAPVTVDVYLRVIDDETVMIGVGVDPGTGSDPAPVFDACGGTGAEWNSETQTVSTPRFGDYVFAGWYTEPVRGTKVDSDFAAGTTYYAHWTNKAGKTVLTEPITIGEDGVYIGDSQTPATEEQLAPYGLAFNTETDSAPATLSMNGVTIESGDGVLADGWNLDKKNVYAAIYSECAIELKLTGENKISIARNDMNTVPCGGFFGKSLTVTGSGTLTFDENGASGYHVFGLYVDSDLINNGTLTADAGGAESGNNLNGLYVGSDLINNGTLTADAENTEGKNVYGLYVRENLTNSGTITASAADSVAEGGVIGVFCTSLENTGNITGYAGSGECANGLNIYNGDANISGGKVVGYGGTGTVEYYGLWTDGDINVSGTGVLELHGGTKSGSDPVVKEALFLENSDKTITISDSGKIVADSAVKNDGKYADGYTVTGADTDIASKFANSELTKAGDANIEIFAKTYTVSFNANGGTPAPSAQSTMAYVTEPTVTRSGYAFADWYKDDAFTQMWDMEHDYARKDLTLYAKWVKDTAVGNIGGTVLGEDENPVGDTLVRLKRGAAICGEFNTASDGKFKFEGIPAGEYQLVVTKNGNTTTTLVRLIEGVEELEEAITLYTDAKTSSAVEITGDATPDVMVGGLAEVAYAKKDDGGDTVSVTLEVEKLTENAVNSGDKTKIEAAANDAQTLDYIDMTLVFKINNIRQDDIVDTEGTLLEVVIPYHLSGRNNIALYRQHGEDASAVKLPEGAANKTDKGEYVIIDKENNLIRAYLRYFSTYAIGYEEEQSHGGGGGGSSSYAIELPANVKNGKVEVSPKNASAGQTVTLTVTPDKGFTLETLTVLDKNGKQVEVKNLGNNKFSFKMPSGKVSISATFMEDNSMLNFFVDVKATDYYYDAVLWAAENGITKGTDDVHFSPNAPVTRAQVVTFLWRAAGCPEPVGNSDKFTDLLADQYYIKAVAWAIEQGITKGVTDTTFEPEMVCTRGQIVTFLARFAGVEDADTESVFTDVPANEFFAAAVKWAKDNGVTSGVTDTTFEPYTNCTRAQVVTFLYRWMVK